MKKFGGDWWKMVIYWRLYNAVRWVFVVFNRPESRIETYFCFPVHNYGAGIGSHVAKMLMQVNVLFYNEWSLLCYGEAEHTTPYAREVLIERQIPSMCTLEAGNRMVKELHKFWRFQMRQDCRVFAVLESDWSKVMDAITEKFPQVKTMPYNTSMAQKESSKHPRRES